MNVLHACHALVPASHLVQCLIRFFFYTEVPS